MTELNFFKAAAQVGALETLDVAGMELLMRVEFSGEDFYFALADRIGNDEAADLLRKNGREETGHARRLERAIALKQGREYERAEEAHPRFSIPLPDTIDASLFPAIVQAELDGDAGYQRWADREPNADVAKLLRQNGREETVHGERVRRVAEILNAS